jgi:signal transduction histidine kinase
MARSHRRPGCLEEALRSGFFKAYHGAAVAGRHRGLVAGAGAQEPPGGAGGVQPPDAPADAGDRARTARPTTPCRRPAVAERAKQQAEQANQAKSRYISAISHELRTPLNSILGYAQLMGEDTSMPAHRRQAVNVIKRGGEHLLSLIEGTLDMARIESGKLTLHVKPMQLCRHGARDGKACSSCRRSQGSGLSLRVPKAPCPRWCGPTKSACARSSSTCWAMPSSSRRGAA